MKAFSDVITDKAISDEGVFTVHKVDDKYYFEIPMEILDREMLLVSRVAGTTQNLSFGGAGQKARAQHAINYLFTFEISCLFVSKISCLFIFFCYFKL